MSLSFKNIGDVRDYICEHSIEYIDFKFMDNSGSVKSLSLSAECINNKELFSFSNPSIKIGDIEVFPDFTSAFFEPFTSGSVISIFCNLASNECPRSTMIRAISKLPQHKLMVKKIIAEIDFYIFENVKYSMLDSEEFYLIDSEEMPSNAGRSYEYGNTAHRFEGDCSYSTQPNDKLYDLRLEIFNTMKKSSLSPLAHMHGASAGQCKFILDITSDIDAIQKFKYIVKNVAASFGKSATFMPKPAIKCNISNISYNFIFETEKGENAFYDKNNGQVLDFGRKSISGILSNMKSLIVFSNSSTNSFRGQKLLQNIRQFEFISKKSSKVFCKDGFFSINFPDGSSNSYLCLSAIFMAMIDGLLSTNIIDKLNKNFSVNFLESLSVIEKNKKFLLKDGVFKDSQIKKVLSLYRKILDSDDSVSIPPAEFGKFYSC